MSDCLGVARGTAPKRSRSARGPPVCIISIAQQAKPNSIYQTEDLRLQLSTSSTFVVTTISDTLLIRDMQPPADLYLTQPAAVAPQARTIHALLTPSHGTPLSQDK